MIIIKINYINLIKNNVIIHKIYHIIINKCLHCYFLRFKCNNYCFTEHLVHLHSIYFFNFLDDNHLILNKNLKIYNRFDISHLINFVNFANYITFHFFIKINFIMYFEIFSLIAIVQII